MYCSNCATQLPNGAKFCHNCANPVSPGQAATVAPVVVINAENKRKVSLFGIVEAFCAVILITLLVFGGLYYYRKHYREEKPLFQIKQDGTTEINVR